MLSELIARIFQQRDEKNCRGVRGTKGVKTRRTTDKREEPCGFSRKVMGFNKNLANITVDLRSFTGLLWLLLIVTIPSPYNLGPICKQPVGQDSASR
jgi:hypothetical protein